MQLNWRYKADPSSQRESQLSIMADLPGGHAAKIVELNDGRMQARIYNVATGEISRQAAFGSQDEAKAWVEEQVERMTDTAGSAGID